MIHYLVGEPCHTQIELARYSGHHLFLVVVDDRLGSKETNTFWYSCDAMNEVERFQINLSNAHRNLGSKFSIEYCPQTQ